MECYLSRNFFGGVRASQRCERMHTLLYSFLHRHQRLFEFESALASLWNTNTEESTRSDKTIVVPANVVSLEIDAANVYTGKVFIMVRKQLRRQGLYYEVDKIDVGNHLKYSLSKYD